MIQKFHALLGSVILVSLVLGGVFDHTQANPDRVESPNHRNSIENRFIPPQKTPTDNFSTEIPTATDRPAIGGEYPYSKMVFESVRDDNWEIYIGNPGTPNSTHTRLTNHPENDLLPRLNRGSTKIVFISRRTGNYEIFTMNPDGSTITQLTNNITDDLYPAWSPDGKKIAFQAYRDGQAEIYVMNADGSNQQRITFNSEYDGQPGWSPDGKKIVFTAYRNGGYRIWVMNSDGTGQIRLSDQPYSGDPVWSPDGTYIAYDSDDDDDGWFDVWKMDSNGSGQRKLSISKLPYTDLLARGWSPDSAYISYTEVKYTSYAGQWYWYSSFLAAVDFSSFDWSGYLCYDSDNWEPDWQTTETTVPRSAVLPLPAFSPASGFMVDWRGTDTGPAGIASYTIQTENNASGVWSDWKINTSSTSSSYSGSPGDTVAFRARAIDAAYNLEKWPVNQDTSTRLYQWEATGQVIDARGQPIPGALTTNTPMAMNEGELTGSDGIFRNYLTTNYTSTKIDKNGYGALPELDLAASETHSDWWALPPVDNRIENGEFEHALLTGWAVSPQNSVSIATINPLSGDYLAKAGYSFWTEPKSIWHYQYSIGHPQIVRDANQKLHVIWPDSSQIAGDQTPGNTDIFYSYMLASGEWTYPIIINPSHSLGSTGPSLATAADGAIHAAWMDKSVGGENSYIRYAYKPQSGNWSVPETVVGPINIFYNQTNHLVKVAVDGLGTVHIIWGDQSGPWYSYKVSGGNWSPKVNLPGYGDNQDLAITPDNSLHRIWLDYSINTYNLYHATKIPAGNWSASEIVASNVNVDQLHLAASPVDNSLHAVWINDPSSSISYSTKPDGSGWDAPLLLGESGEQAYTLTLGVNTEQVFVSWYGSEGQKLQMKQFDNTWTSLENLEISCSEQSLIANITNKADMMCVKWDSSSGSDLLYTPVQFINQSERILSQSLDLPSGLHKPTLSFGSWIKASGAGMLEVLINGVPIYSIDEPSNNWAHNWIDLEPWKGQSITVDFRITKITNDHMFQVFLDDISIGSWLTPIISSVTPGQVILPGSPVVVITGENFIPIPEVWFGQTQASAVAQLDDVTLSAVVPDSLPPGYYDVHVINPGGQEAVKNRGLLVGHLVSLPLLVRYLP